MSVIVGEPELTNGPSREAPVVSRCTDQAPYFDGSLILVGN